MRGIHLGKSLCIIIDKKACYISEKEVSASIELTHGTADYEKVFRAFPERQCVSKIVFHLADGFDFSDPPLKITPSPITNKIVVKAKELLDLIIKHNQKEE